MSVTMDKLRNYELLGNPISEKMFGAKLERVYGPSNTTPYDRVLSELNSSSIRFSYDVDAGVHDNLPISVYEALSYSAGSRRPIVLCLVTKNLFIDEQNSDQTVSRKVDLSKVRDIKNFVKDLLAKDGPASEALPDAVVDAIELGNEYWGLGDMTSEEYGKLVNVLAVAVQEAIDELGSSASSDPKILVQMGSAFSKEFDSQKNEPGFSGVTWAQSTNIANNRIISQISRPAQQAIDGLVEHYYHTSSWDTFIYGSAALRGIDLDLSVWASRGYAKKEVYITEWNNKTNNPSQFGLKGAGVLLEMFENMVRLGVDAANIWPLQHNETRLLDTLSPDEDGSLRITPRGAIFKLMAESLIGAQRIESNLCTENGYSYELNGYVSAHETIFFISSRSSREQLINLDLSSVVGSGSTAEGLLVGFDPKTADGFYSRNGHLIAVPKYQDPDALAHLTNLRGIGSSNDLKLNLGAFEVVRLVFPKEIHKPSTAGQNENILGSAGRDRLHGTLSNDYMRGYSGGDQIYGSAGSDTLNGGSGSDVLSGGFGFDIASYQTATSMVVANLTTPTHSRGEAAGDTFTSIEGLCGSRFADKLIGNLKDNRIEGGNGSDVLRGESGNDTLIGGAGADRLFGGTGIDLVSYESAPFRVVANLEKSGSNRGEAFSDTIFDVEGVIGSKFDDLIVGKAGKESLFGGAGNDTLIGGGSADKIVGGHGFDISSFQYSLSGVVVSFTAPLLNRGEAKGDKFLSIEGLTGSRYCDSLTGDRSANRLEGIGGSDVLRGEAGNDTLIGGPGADRLLGGAGVDIISFESSPSSIVVDLECAANNRGDAIGDTYESVEGVVGTKFDDLIVGLGSRDLLFGGIGNDTLIGGQGADRLSGGPGFDWISYSTSRSEVTVDLARPFRNRGDARGDSYIHVEAVRGGKFSDNLSGDSSANVVEGANGDDRIFGGGGDDRLLGGAGSDSLSGGSGDDVLRGGRGRDSLFGGGGADVFMLNTFSQGGDLVCDYDPSQHDILTARQLVSANDIGVTFQNSSGFGETDLAEAYIRHLPSGQLLWILEDGVNLESIYLRVGSTEVDLV